MTDTIESGPKDERALKVQARTRVQLASIPDLMTHLSGMRAPGSAPQDPDARRATTNPSRPTVRLEVVDLLDHRLSKAGSDARTGTRDLELDKLANGRRLGILGTLWCWVVLVEAELADSDKPVDLPSEDVASICGWLTRHLDWILDQHPDFAEDVNWMHQDLTRSAGMTPPKPVPCRHCGGTVDAKDDGTWYQCRGCKAQWLFAAEMIRIGQDANRMMTLAQCATTLGVSLKTLKLTAGKRFLPVGKNPAGANLYDVNVVKRAQDLKAQNARAGGKPGRKWKRMSA